MLAGLEFYNFSSIYPEFLYPGGGTKEHDRTFSMKKPVNVEIHNSLAWYNPLSWISAGLNSKGKILHFHWWTYWLFPVFFTIAAVAKLRGKKVVCTIHNVVGHESSPVDRLLSGIIYSLPDSLIVHTQVNRRQLEENFNISGNKVAVVPHGIYDFYRDAEVGQAKARELLGIPSRAKVILMFGNLRPYKGAEDLVSAFKVAKKSLPSIFLVVAGKPWDDEIRDYLRRELGAERSCLLSMGYVPSSEIKSYFSSADLVVLPYKDFAAQSGPGNIALAFQKPLLVSDTGGLPELVLDRRAVFPAGNAHELAARISGIFSKKGLIEKLARDSASLKQKYSWGSIAELTLKIYNGLEP